MKRSSMVFVVAALFVFTALPGFAQQGGQMGGGMMGGAAGKHDARRFDDGAGDDDAEHDGHDGAIVRDDG